MLDDLADVRPYGCSGSVGCTTLMGTRSVGDSGMGSGTTEDERRGDGSNPCHPEAVDANDQTVGQGGRSRFLEEAAREKLKRLELEHVLASRARVLRTKHCPEFEDKTSINEWVRAQRRTEEAS